MNKFDKAIVSYITIAIIPVMVLLIWGGAGDADKLSLSSGMTRYFWDTLGWIFMIWIVAMLILTLKMVFVKDLRESILAKFARIKERDEREEIISGEAAKFTLLSTLAVMFLLLFFSLFTVKVGKYPEGSLGKDKHGFISIGMNFYPFTKDAHVKETKSNGQEFFNYSGMPLSSSIVMLLMILWQLGSYQFVVRRLNHDEN
jgi:hypothetical protein